MKKRLTLIFSSAFLTIGMLTALTVYNSGSAQFDGNGQQGSKFSIAVNSSSHLLEDPDIKYNANVYGAMSGNTTKINTTFKKGSLSDEKVVISAHNYVTWQNDEDSPIRGISSIKFDFESFNPSNLQFFFYFSYNHLNLADIFNGKYSDLVSIYPMGGSSADLNSITYTVNQLQARYFLAVIMNVKEENLNICGGSVRTPCDPEGEPEVVPEVGEYVVPAEHKELLPDDFPEITNGSYYYEVMMSMPVFYMLQDQSNLGNISTALSNKEYIAVGTMMGAFVFQKATETEGKYKTILLSLNDSEFHGDVLLFQLAYYGIRDYMGSDGSWPVEKINQIITESDISDAFVAPVFTTITPFYNFMAMDPMNAITIDGVEGTAANLEEAYSTFKAYGSTLASSGKFIKTTNEYTSGFDNDGHITAEATEVSYSGSLLSYNLKYSVSIMIYAEKTNDSQWKINSLTIAIEQLTTSDLSSINNNIVSVFGEDIFPVLEVTFTNCSKAASYSSSEQYFMTGATISSFDNYFAALEEKGFDVYEAYEGQAKYASKQIDGKYYSFNVTSRGQYIEMFYGSY